MKVPFIVQNEIGHSADDVHVGFGVEVQGASDKGMRIFATAVIVKDHLFDPNPGFSQPGACLSVSKGERGQCMRDQLFHRPKSERESIERSDDRLPAAQPNAADRLEAIFRKFGALVDAENYMGVFRISPSRPSWRCLNVGVCFGTFRFKILTHLSLF